MSFLIGERFSKVASHNSSIITKAELLDAVNVFYKGAISDRIKFVFEMYDFNNDGSISSSEVRLLISHIPLVINLEKQRDDSNFDYFVENQSDIISLIGYCFKEKDTMSFEEFVKITLDKSCDMFFVIFQYIRDSLPLFYCTTTPNSKHNSVCCPSLPEQKISMITHLTNLAPVRPVIESIHKIKEDLMDVPYEQSSIELKCSTPKSNILSEIGSFSESKQAKESTFLHGITIPKPILVKETSYEVIFNVSNLCSLQGKLYCMEYEVMVESSVRIDPKVIHIKNRNGERQYPLQYYYAELDYEVNFIGNIYYPILLNSFDFPSIKLFCKSKADQLNWQRGINMASSKMALEDKYIVGNLIGSGSFGSVYIGTSKETNETVAIKIIKRKKCLAFSSQLKKETDILKLCKHPNIVRFIDVLEYPHYIALVMEFLSGGNLKVCMQTKLSLPRIKAIMDGVSSALYYLKTIGIVHRDIKLDNILFQNSYTDGEVKIVDFGLLSICEPQSMVNGFVGTPEYLCPEVILKRNYDSKADVWSLGVVFYMLLCGDAPFKGNSQEELYNSILKEEPDYDFIDNNRGQQSLSLLTKMLKKDPEERISIKEVRMDLFFGNKKAPTDKLLKFKVFSSSMRKIRKMT